MRGKANDATPKIVALIPDSEEAADFDRQLREALSAHGVLNLSEQRVVISYQPLAWSPAERTDWRRYEPGMVLDVSADGTTPAQAGTSGP